jgi:hypothetical protein
MHRASGYADRPRIRGLPEEPQAPESDSLARAFSRLGWIGFWAQVTIGTIPVLLMIYAFIFGRNATAGTRAGLAIIEYLTIVNLLVLAFTATWSYRYTRFGKQLADPENRPPISLLRQAAWTGVAASALGILFSILVMLLEAGQLFFYFLRAPQAGVPVIQTTRAGPSSWVSAADIMTILALNISLLVEFVVLGFSLWLLFRSMSSSAELPDLGSEP